MCKCVCHYMVHVSGTNTYHVIAIVLKCMKINQICNSQVFTTRKIIFNFGPDVRLTITAGFHLQTFFLNNVWLERVLGISGHISIYSSRRDAREPWVQCKSKLPKCFEKFKNVCRHFFSSVTVSSFCAPELCKGIAFFPVVYSFIEFTLIFW